MKIQSLTAIYEGLNELAQAQPHDPASLRLWYESARDFSTRLRSDPSLCDLVPIRIWQFLSDADIRMKDDNYAKQQQRIVSVFLAGLKEGVVLSAEQIDERMDAVDGQ